MSLLIVDRHRDIAVGLVGAAAALGLGPACAARDTVAALRRLELDPRIRAVIAERELGEAWIETFAARREWDPVPLLLTSSDLFRRRPLRADAVLARPFHVGALPRALRLAYRRRMLRRSRLLLVASRGVWDPSGWDAMVARSPSELAACLREEGNRIGALVIDPRGLPSEIGALLRRYARSREGMPAAVACLSRDPALAREYRESAHFFVESPSRRLAASLRGRLRDRWAVSLDRAAGSRHFAESLVARGARHLTEARPRSARRLFLRALALNPFLPAAHLGLLTVAPEHWEAARRYCPRHREVLRKAAECTRTSPDRTETVSGLRPSPQWG